MHFVLSTAEYICRDAKAFGFVLTVHFCVGSGVGWNFHIV